MSKNKESYKYFELRVRTKSLADVRELKEKIDFKNEEITIFGTNSSDGEGFYDELEDLPSVEDL